MSQTINTIYHKIVSLETAKDISKEWRASNQTIVFTNGCFDLLHLGHIDYLARAKDLGNKLIIGINSDKSVSTLKGEHRPIKDELSRATILASLDFVDLVIIFDDPTPINLIQNLLPNVLVKGADYTIDKVVGADFILKNGGRVELINYLEGHSTSLIESKIRNQT